ncbi:MAG: HAD-IIA family hydrolase [Bdellovibrionales bacterium]|nr:HAD-IIA family hydrolase [Bdellovibrionales bacterium]
MLPEKTTFKNLIDCYELFLFDAYGVLVTAAGPIAAAREALDFLRSAGKEFRIVTNDASRNGTQQLEHYAGMGFPVKAENIISSGSLVADYFKENELFGASTLVLGPEGAYDYVTKAGGEILDFNEQAEPEVVVILDRHETLDLQQCLGLILSVVLRALQRGRVPHLVVANPDLNYPAGPEYFGIASGSFALLLEANLQNNFPSTEPIRFERLGKPYAPIFDKAIDGRPRSEVLFIGDQFTTDIVGANRAGISSALVLTGVSREEAIPNIEAELHPRYILPTLAV